MLQHVSIIFFPLPSMELTAAMNMIDGNVDQASDTTTLLVYQKKARKKDYLSETFCLLVCKSFSFKTHASIRFVRDAVRRRPSTFLLPVSVAHPKAFLTLCPLTRKVC